MESTPGRIKKDVPQTGTTLPVVGYLSIGEKVYNPAGVATHAKSNNYFRVRGKGGEVCKYEAQFKAVYGDKPTVVQIAFISDDEKESCNQQYENWENGKRWGWGDGEVYHIWDVTKKDYIPVGKDHPQVIEWWKDNPKTKKPYWQERLNMTFVMPRIAGVLGVFKFSTGGSKSSIPEITRTFDFIKSKAGTIQFFPFDLMLESHTGKNPGEAKSWKITKLVPSFSQESVRDIRQLFAAGNFAKLQEAAMLSLSDSEIRQIAQASPKIEVKEDEVQEVEVVESNPLPEAKQEPVVETKPAMQPNPRADDVDDIINKSKTVEQPKTTPSLKSVTEKKNTPGDLFGEGKK